MTYSNLSKQKLPPLPPGFLIGKIGAALYSGLYSVRENYCWGIRKRMGGSGQGYRKAKTNKERE
jgi:hypothetical protein